MRRNVGKSRGMGKIRTGSADQGSWLRVEKGRAKGCLPPQREVTPARVRPVIACHERTAKPTSTTVEQRYSVQ
jgi:hypothetical protein